MSETKQGLVLDRVVLLGRTYAEYLRCFALDPSELAGRAILDLASGVSSFRAEAAAHGLDVTACDLIYDQTPEAIRARCEPDLQRVSQAMQGLPTYRWEFYRDAEGMRQYRARAYQTFLADYSRTESRGRYVAARLPALPFSSAQFELTLVSYLLFVYEDQFDYAFHQRSVLEIMRVTRGEARMYPLVTFEAKRSSYIERLQQDPALNHLTFEVVQTDFEFLRNSNCFLRVRHRQCAARSDGHPGVSPR